MKTFLRPVDKKGLMLWLVFAVLIVIASEYFTQIPLFVSSLVALNVSVYLVMMIDKFQATQSSRRLSERSLFIMTLLGGSIGMVSAMYSLHHKNRKTSFQMVVWGVVLIQLIILYLIYSPSFTL